MQKAQKIHASEIVHHLACGLITFTDDGSIQFINNYLLELLGYQTEDLEGKKFEVVLSLASRIFYQTHLFPLLKLNGKAEEIFLSLRSKDALDIPVLIYGKRIQAGEQWVNNCTVVPVWQRQKYEEEILKAKQAAEKAVAENAELIKIQQELAFKSKQLDKQIVRLTQINNDYTDFSKIISHDLQEPIRKISLFANIIKESPNISAERINDYFEKINNNINRLNQLTHSLGKYVSLNNIRESAQEILLHEVIANSATQVISDLNFDEFEMDIQEIPGIQGYPQQIRQLFYELIKNSIQFRAPQRKLRIAVKGIIAQYNDFKAHEDRYKYIDFVRIEFNDNATGFSNEYSKYVFQLSNRLHSKSEGIGFGLTVCKKIVENHFGSISCSSQADTGTTFIILLPVTLQDVTN